MGSARLIHIVNDGRQKPAEEIDELEIRRRAEVVRRVGLERWREFDWYSAEEIAILEERMSRSKSYPISSGLGSG